MGTTGVLERAQRVFDIEANAILRLKERIDESFLKAVNIILACTGKVIVTGIGKSGLVSKKIASTFACSGTPAFFLHPSEGMHGDIGMLSQEDVVLAISNSGETEEVVKLLPLIKRRGLPLIVMTGNIHSLLARNGDVVLNIGVEQEACSLNLVPTASTAATMAMGDALAIAVLERRGFSETDFAMLHPGGALGKKLLLTVEDLMHVKDAIPIVKENDSMKVILIEMTSKRLGVTAVCDENGALTGVITDGDLRRALERMPDIFATKAYQIMTAAPKTIEKTALAATALQVMEKHSITSLFILGDQIKRNVIGVIHLHDILRAGVV
ncbi:MAG: KpsF/GutQ family sugar-phosphate isomerase [Desulfobacterota bacterium]|nr:KpsF/GutQ family sugar-phosphate isomerase [Thermodesulfobacteriota bacterium]